MSDWNGFGSLDLSNVEASGGSARLQPGTYTVKCSNAKVEQIGSTNNRKLVADFVDVDGSGDIRVNFNILHSSDMAQEIGRRQLKSFLIAANHPNPDKPGDVDMLKGLQCKIIVGMGKPWKGDDGLARQSSEVKKFMAMGMAEAAASAGSKSDDMDDDMDDEIPF